jgi:hypothetical protein
LFKVVHDNVLAAGVEVRMGVAAVRLIADPATREIRGVTVSDSSGKEQHVAARLVRQ